MRYRHAYLQVREVQDEKNWKKGSPLVAVKSFLVYFSDFLGYFNLRTLLATKYTTSDILYVTPYTTLSHFYGDLHSGLVMIGSFSTVLV